MISLNKLKPVLRSSVFFASALGLTACLSTPEKPTAPDVTVNTSTNVVSVSEQETRSIEQLSDYARSGLIIIDADFKQDYRNALTAIEQNELQEAASQLDALIVRRPDLTGPIYNRALLAQALKDDDTAQQLLTRAHTINPFDVRVCSLLGKQFREQGKFQQAKNLYLACISDETQSAVIHKNYGILLDLYLHQPELALKHYQQYQEMTDGSDKRVKGWVRDLQRRIKRKAAQ